MTAARVRVSVCAALLLLGGTARAQEPVVPTPPAPLPTSPFQPRVEIAVLGGLLSGASLGDTRASMLTNQVPTGSPTALFTTSSAIGAATTVEGRLGVRLTRAWWIEAGLAYGTPDLEVDVAGDVEGVPAVSITTPLTQLIADVSVQYRWNGRRVTPFVSAGGGYLRQLDEPRTTAETGAVFQAGGGVRVAIAPGSRGFARRLALRGDARMVWLRDGVELNEARGASFSVSGGVVLGL